MDGLAPPLVGDPGPGVTAEARDFEALLRAPFYKMTGSGNDFVFLDARATGAPTEVAAERVATLCARGTGVGADGLVILDQPSPGGVRIVYWNSDGSRAALCGNATLCTASLAVHLGAVRAGDDFAIETDAGRLNARVTPSVGPSFELAPVLELIPDTADERVATGPDAESRIGYAVAGVPHLVIRVDDVRAVDLANRSPRLRAPRPARPDGANVNYVSSAVDGGWHMRTFERGVEAETLACGTGAVACAALLQAWGDAGPAVRIHTRSGRPLTVTLRGTENRPTLSGEGRLVFVGSLSAAD